MNTSKILAICGEKNSGKTTIIERIIPLLNKKGIRTSVIKHDAHNFIADTPGTDSYRAFNAGAQEVVVFDNEKFMLTSKKITNEKFLINLFQDTDLIILEGFKKSEYPKIQIVSNSSSCDLQNNVIAIICDEKVSMDIPVIRREDIKEIAKLVLNYVDGKDNFTG